MMTQTTAADNPTATLETRRRQIEASVNAGNKLVFALLAEDRELGQRIRTARERLTAAETELAEIEKAIYRNVPKK